MLQIKDLETERLFGIIRVGPQCHHKAPYTREAQGDSTRTEEPRRWGSGRRTGSRAQKRQETASPWTPGRNQPCRRRDSSPGRLTGARPPGLWRDATWSRWPLVGAALGDPHRRRSRSPSASAPRRREPSSERAPGHILRGLGPQRLLSLCPSGPLAVCVVRGPNRARLSHTRHFPKAQTPVAPSGGQAHVRPWHLPLHVLPIVLTHSLAGTPESPAGSRDVYTPELETLSAAGQLLAVKGGSRNFPQRRTFWKARACANGRLHGATLRPPLGVRPLAEQRRDGVQVVSCVPLGASQAGRALRPQDLCSER